jgi:HEAT repeat protein
MVMVASLAIITGIGWKFWDTAIITSTRLKIWNTFSTDDSIRLLRSGGGTSDERLNAARNLWQVGGDDEIDEAIATLIATLGDEDVDVRTMAARSLGSLVSQTQSRGQKTPLPPEQMKKWQEAATKALVKGLSDNVPEFRVAVCTCLQMIKSRNPNWQGSRQLWAAIEKGTVKWNRTTVKEYSGLSDEAPPPELVAALKDESMVVRRAVILTLAQFALGLDSVIPILFPMLEDSNPSTRLAAGQVLNAAWPTSVIVPTLIDGLKSQNRDVRWHSARLLGQVGPEASAAVPLLTAILEEPIASTPAEKLRVGTIEPSLSREAAIALVRIAPDETTLKLLVEMLSTGKPDQPGIPERWTDAAEALREMGPQAREAVPALTVALNQLLDSQKPMPEPYGMVDAIGRISRDSAHSAATVDVLMRLLDPKYQAWYPNTRSHAVEILGTFGRMATVAIPKLKALQNEKGLLVDTAAAAAASVAAIEADSKLNPSGGNSR